MSVRRPETAALPEAVPRLPLPQPLRGVRVLEVADRRVAYAGRLLAGLGAEVILIEAPERRRDAPTPADLYFRTGKKAVTLDLTAAAGRHTLHRLAAHADVLLLAGPSTERRRLGLTFEDLHPAFPRLVVGSIADFGLSGPDADRPANELVAFAESGLMYISGTPGEPPVAAPPHHAADLAGAYLAFGVLVALWERARTRRGREVEVSVQEALAVEEHTISTASDEGRDLVRVGSQHMVAVPGSVFRVKDGYVHAYVADTMPGSWERLLEWMGHPPELADERYRQGLYRRAHVEEITPVVARFFARFTRQELYLEGQRRRLCITPVNTPREYLEDVQTRTRGFVVQTRLPGHGWVGVPGSPFLLNGHRVPPAGVPRPGEHNREVYLGLVGYGEEELAALAQSGVV